MEFYKMTWNSMCKRLCYTHTHRIRKGFKVLHFNEFKGLGGKSWVQGSNWQMEPSIRVSRSFCLFLMKSDSSLDDSISLRRWFLRCEVCFCYGGVEIIKTFTIQYIHNNKNLYYHTNSFFFFNYYHTYW